jgi:hypothetical protein
MDDRLVILPASLRKRQKTITGAKQLTEPGHHIVQVRP